jgi:hypothetical protein
MKNVKKKRLRNFGLGKTRGFWQKPAGQVLQVFAGLQVYAN